MNKILFLVAFLLINSLHAGSNDSDFIEYAKVQTIIWEKGCNDDNLTSCRDVGLLYANGTGVNQNYSKAKVFFEKACDGNESEGCWYLGILYERKGLERKGLVNVIASSTPSHCSSQLILL